MSGDDDEWAVDDDQFDDPHEKRADAPADDEDEEWRFSLEDLEDDAGRKATETSGAAAAERDDDSDVGGNVFGSLQSATEEIEPGSPSLENVFFVVVGIVLALLLFAQFLLVIVG